MLHYKSADGAPNHSIKWAQLFFFSLALIPWSQCRPMHVNAICQQGESLRCELQFELPGLHCFWPEERAFFQPFGHQPQARAIEVEDVAVPAASRQARPSGSLRLAVSARSGGLRLKRVRRRLVKTKSAPLRTSSLSRSPTAACRPSNPLRMSIASRQTKTFKLPVKLNMIPKRGL